MVRGERCGVPDMTFENLDGTGCVSLDGCIQQSFVFFGNRRIYFGVLDESTAVSFPVLNQQFAEAEQPR